MKTEKACTQCKTVLPLESFYKDKRTTDGRYSECKACSNKRSKSAYSKGRLRFKEWRLKRVYGIGLAEYESMLARQQGCCSICEQDLNNLLRGVPVVDHCHTTGLVRGIICSPCNTMLGMASDKTEVLRAAIRYIEGASKQSHLTANAYIMKS